MSQLIDGEICQPITVVGSGSLYGAVPMMQRQAFLYLNYQLRGENFNREGEWIRQYYRSCAMYRGKA